jgi:N-sulfoglucosamine sulfohydrolase
MPNNVKTVSRRELLYSGAALAAAATTNVHADEPKAPRPNILLFHCHDLGQYLGCYGYKTVRSPNLDAFASEGVRFASMWCTAPQCSPSRASLFTGRYPHCNGVMGLAHADFAWDLHEDEKHLAQRLKEAGYATEAIGVIHETRSGAARCGYDNHIGKSRASEMATAAIDRLGHFAKNEKRPFFLCMGCIEPHRLKMKEQKDYQGFLSEEFGPDDSLGVDVPPFLRDTPGTRAELAELQGSVHHMDAQFGRVMKALDDLGLRDNTLVIFTTDHGYAMPRSKCSVYDPGLQVALMMRLPSRKGWNGGVVRDEMIQNLDVVPTNLELIEVKIPDNIQGRSFAPLLDGGAYAPRDVIFGEISHHDYYDPRRSVRTKTHKLIVNFSSAPAYMDPSQSWRPRSDTVVPKDHATAYHKCCELYDLQTDPWEQNDLAESPEHAETKTSLLKRLREHLVSTKDPILDGAIMPPLHRKSLRLLEV